MEKLLFSPSAVFWQCRPETRICFFLFFIFHLLIFRMKKLYYRVAVLHIQSFEVMNKGENHV